MYIKRTLESFFIQANTQFPVLLITGPRQVGKTTFLQNLKKQNRTYITLDDPLLASLAKEEPRLFLERFKPPLLIDEIQYAPQLLPFIKMHVDSNHIPGQFWLTGSQQFHLMKGVSESLAGRVGIVNMLGLSLWEYQDLASYHKPFLPLDSNLDILSKKVKSLSLQELYNIIWRGFFPAVTLNQNINHSLFYGSYVQTYIQRDVRDLAKVGDELTFLKFLRATAARTGALLNLADLAKDCDISPPTAKSWLSILQTSGLVYLLMPYHSNVTKRIIKTPKLYFLDTGLCSYLTGWSTPETLEAGAMSGSIFESFAIQEIIKSYWHNGRAAPLYYYRDKDQKEIDLLIIQDDTVYPIEIKKTSSPNKKAIQHFSALDKFPFKKGGGGVVCFSDRVLPMTKNVNIIPISFI